MLVGVLLAGTIPMIMDSQQIHHTQLWRMYIILPAIQSHITQMAVMQYQVYRMPQNCQIHYQLRKRMDMILSAGIRIQD